MRFKHITHAAATLALALGFGVAQAQDYPNRPIRVIAPFPAGSGPDVNAREMAAKLTPLLGQTVIVENRPGAAGAIGTDAAAKAAPDGYTLYIGTTSTLSIVPYIYSKLTFNAERDFTPIVLVGVTPNLLICNETQPAKTVKDLVNYCKQSPGRVSFASAGGGSAQHLALEMFKLRAGIDALHVPYKGSGPALTDLIGGQVQYCFETMTSATPHVKSGKVLAIAQTRLKRAKGHPGVPTMDEQGFAGFDATTWYGLTGPAHMNPAFVKRMNEDVNRVMAMPDVIEKFDQYGAEDGGGSPERFGEFIRSETVKWAKVIKDGKVQADS